MESVRAPLGPVTRIDQGEMGFLSVAKLSEDFWLLQCQTDKRGFDWAQ